MNGTILGAAIGAAMLLGLGCSSSSTTTSAPSGGVGVPSAGDAQTPPSTNAKDVKAWLAGGAYKSWKCETASHPAKSPSPHGINRICSNNISTAYTAKGGGERPRGTANVKELYDAAGTNVVGYAVEVKTNDLSNGGASWYWYEDPGTGPVADGFGTTGGAKTICVGCHSAAGSDAAHTTSTNTGEFVYTEVN